MREQCRIALIGAVVALAALLAAGPAQAADPVQLDLSGAFNMDAICGPGEFLETRLDGSHDQMELFGNVPAGNGYWVQSSSTMMVADSSTQPYSVAGEAGHPLYMSGTNGLPSDGVLTGGNRSYKMASFGGNALLSGDWTQVADPSTFAKKANCVVVGAYHSKADWQISTKTIELTAGQKGRYSSINLTLCAMNMAHKARNLRIKALYGASGTDEVVLYSFATTSGGSGPIMTAAAPADFTTIYTMGKWYNSTSATMGNVVTGTSRLFEFTTALALDTSKTLWGLKLEDVNPSLNWAARGLAVFAATAVPANVAPTAAAGSDQIVHDTDRSGSESVTLNGSGSSDSDGTIASYVWKEGANQIATGVSPSVSLSAGTHTIVLTVTDNDGATAEDTVSVEVNTPPVANAGSDITASDTDGNGTASVSLNGSASSDSDGSVASYVWKEGANQIATGSTANLNMATGAHTITLTVTDDDGATASDTVSVDVNVLPIANAGNDQSVADSDGNGSQAVTLSGSASSDSDGTIASYVWKESATQIATGASPQVTLAVGQHTITLTVTDNDGASDSDTVLVEVYEPSSPKQVDLTSAFNADGICGPKEYQVCRTNGLHDLTELFGNILQGNAEAVADSNVYIVADSASMPYSITGDAGHPVYLSGTNGLPADGILSGAGSRPYYLCSTSGNTVYSGDWTEVADPSGYAKKYNCVIVGAAHSKATWQVSSATIELSASLKRQYENVNFVLAAYDYAHKARNMRIKALYGASGTDEEVLYSFSTATGGSGPLMTNSSVADFAVVYTMGKTYNASSGATGNVVTQTVRFWEFASPLALNSGKTLWGFKIEDVNPSLNWAARGLVVFAITPMTAAGANAAPVADAGSDQTVHDGDHSGAASVTLDGSGSSDSDGTVASWVWSEGATQLATGATPTFDLSLGTHTITLTVTDNDSATASDTVVVHVNEVPVVAAGFDQTVYDDDDSGAETVNLEGDGSTDPDGTIASYVWKEGATQIATGATPSVSLNVGTHTLTLVATDDDGGSASDTVVITVSSNRLPVASAGDDEAAQDTDDNGTVTISLDGTGSSDTDGSISTYVWKSHSGLTVATGATPSVTLPVGINDLTLEVTDNESGVSRDVVRLWVMPKVDFWVDASIGSNGNAGTSEGSPWATIDYAVDNANVTAGSVICVKGGTYRERPSLGRSGSSGNPITLLGYPFERVKITGADAVTGWAQCTSQIAKSNPNYQNIYYVDIAWKPTRLMQDDGQLPKARWPHNGWFLAQGGTTSTLVDAANLVQADDYWNGATVVLWDMSATGQAWRTVTDYSAATATLTISGTWSAVEANADIYFIENMVQLIDQAGEWAVEDMGGGSYRVYCWAAGGGDPDSFLMEASRRDRFGLEWGDKGYWTFDNLEVCYAIGSGMGCWSGANPGYITVQNCTVHHNDVDGISGANNPNGVYRNNLIIHNESIGVHNGGKSNVTFENNEVGFNNVDGLRAVGPDDGTNWAENVTVRGNYIHDHFMWSHADNMQTYGQIRDLAIEDNLLLCGGQSLMMEGTDDVTLINNTILGCVAVSIINGHGNTSDVTLDFNTVCFSGYQCINNSGSGGYYYSNSIFMKGNVGQIWGIADAGTAYAADYNCFWNGPGISYNPITWPGTSTFAGYQAASGDDTHSSYADPRFANVPDYFFALDNTKQHLFTTTKVYMRSGETSYISVGDHVEIDFDGVVRTVQSVDTTNNFVTFTPGADNIQFKCAMICNWKARTDFSLDFTLKSGSPALGSASDQSDMGSQINAGNYILGDFNGDGRRDIPSWPPAE